MTLPPLPSQRTPARAEEGSFRRSPLEMPMFGATTTGRVPQVPGPSEGPPMPSEPERPRSPVEPTPLPEVPTGTAEPREYTDEDLRDALAPFLTAGPNPPTSSLPDDFEAALRSAIRRTLSQHTHGPFDQPDFVQRVVWRFDALLSSRTYEEVVQEKIRRFRIEEVFLLDRSTLAMISFASVNPSRHVNAHKVHSIVNRLAGQAKELDGPPPLEFSTKKGLRVFVRARGELVLAALIRGEPDSFVGPDLDYALRRVDQTFGSDIADGKPLLKEIQPHLEECLLIHSPIAPTGR